MKKIYLLLLVAISASTRAQTIIFSENMGTPPQTPTLTPIANNTFQNGSPVIFSGDAVMVTPNNSEVTPPSNGYAGASGGGHVLLFASNKTFMVSGLNTAGYANPVLSFGQLKGTTLNSNTLTIEVSADGTEWTPLAYTGVEGSFTDWSLITTTGTIPAAQNLRIRFTNPTVTAATFRIDDMKLTNTPLGIGENMIAGLKIYPNPAASGTVYVSTDLYTQKSITIFDILGKQVIDLLSTGKVDVSGLGSGVYIIKVTEDGRTATRKLVIKQ